MYIPNSALNALIKLLKIEYNGTHNSDTKNLLWGRSAYWRVYAPDGTYLTKITTPVKSINPKQKTLDKLFRAELKKRIGEIGFVLDINHYNQCYILERDPYDVKKIVKLLEREYLDLLEKQTYIKKELKGVA